MTQIFEIHRDVDITGLSGTGVVADGAVFPDGTTVVRWREVTGENYDKGVRATTVVHPNVESVEALHGHGGATRLVFRGGTLSEGVEAPHGDSPCYVSTLDLKAGEVVVHRTDGPCYVENHERVRTHEHVGHSDGPHVRFDANGHYINPPLNTVTEDPA